MDCTIRFSLLSNYEKKEKRKKQRILPLGNFANQINQHFGHIMENLQKKENNRQKKNNIHSCLMASCINLNLLQDHTLHVFFFPFLMYQINFFFWRCFLMGFRTLASCWVLYRGPCFRSSQKKKKTVSNCLVRTFLLLIDAFNLILISKWLSSNRLITNHLTIQSLHFHLRATFSSFQLVQQQRQRTKKTNCHLLCRSIKSPLNHVVDAS